MRRRFSFECRPYLEERCCSRRRTLGSVPGTGLAPMFQHRLQRKSRCDKPEKADQPEGQAYEMAPSVGQSCRSLHTNIPEWQLQHSSMDFARGIGTLQAGASRARLNHDGCRRCPARQYHDNCVLQEEAVVVRLLMRTALVSVAGAVHEVTWSARLASLRAPAGTGKRKASKQRSEPTATCADCIVHAAITTLLLSPTVFLSERAYRSAVKRAAADS